MTIPFIATLHRKLCVLNTGLYVRVAEKYFLPATFSNLRKVKNFARIAGPRFK